MADATTLWELIHTIDPSLTDEAAHHLLPARPFPHAIRLWTILASTEFQKAFFDPSSTYKQSLNMLNTALKNSGLGDQGLTTRVWHYLRFTALGVREWLDQRALGSNAPFRPRWDHDLWLEPAVLESFTLPTRPLERFERYLQASNSQTITATNWREVLTHRSAGQPVDHLRENLKRRGGVCPAGHRVPVEPVREVGKRTSFLCAYCSGRRVIPGETDIASTHPARASYFDFAANSPLLPIDLHSNLPTKVAWVCPLGHTYERSVQGQCIGEEPCLVCNGSIARPGFNTLQDLRPDIAREWHPTLNTKSPSEVTLRGNERAWFICPKGHQPYETMIRSRANGTGCRKCGHALGAHKGQQLISERYPELATQWVPELNDGVRFGEARGISLKHVWRCSRGHEISREAFIRAKLGCGRCSGHVKTPDCNILLEKYPLITSEFHPTANQVSKLQMNASDNYLWICAAGHVRSATLHTRINSRGCSACPRPDRIAYESNEWTAGARGRASNDPALMRQSNYLVKQYPLITSEFHPTKNSVDKVRIRSAQTYVWLCAYGHERETHVHRRVDSRGCPDCPKERRIGYRADDERR
ncbi:hypothetical protein HNR14_000955 [Leifsonia naganoensis]|uniref:Treble clef zinc finger domain-containing protein n=2 Tax=Leifsonia naganoensis TaxID=150025 RepID=A0A853DR75_9MICO|nr:hypothetical protein [Leifsonia naganoensis]